MQDVSVEEDQGTECLILRRGRDLAFQSQVAEELRNFLRTHLRRMTLIVKEDEPTNPANVGILGLGAVVLHANRFANLIQQLGLPGATRCDEMGVFMTDSPKQYELRSD